MPIRHRIIFADRTLTEHQDALLAASRASEGPQSITPSLAKPWRPAHLRTKTQNTKPTTPLKVRRLIATS